MVPTSSRPSWLRPIGMVMAMALIGCGEDDSGGPATVLSFGGNFGWTCSPVGTNCQDVFDFSIPSGAVLTIQVTNVSSGSVAQLALYGPGVALGGTNLLTGSTAELRCTTGAACTAFTAGEQVTGVTVGQAGTYRLAVTRHWGNSCGADGTYRLDVTSNVGFQVLGQTVEDQPSATTTFSCQ